MPLIAGLNIDRNLKTLTDHYTSICFTVQKPIVGLFLAEYISAKGTYNCLTDQPECEIFNMDDLGTVDAEGYTPTKTGRLIKWVDLCGNTREAGYIYYTTKTEVANAMFVNATKDRFDSKIDQQTKEIYTVDGQKFTTTYGLVNGHAIVLDTFVTYNSKVVRTNRGKHPGGDKEITFGDVKGLLPCTFKPQGNFTYGHIVGLTLNGPDVNKNCAWERSKTNGLKSSQIETLYRSPEEYSYRVIEIATHVSGVPYPKRFVHTVRTKAETCIFWFDQDAEYPDDQFRHACTPTTMTKYNFMYAITAKLQNTFGYVRKFIGSYIHDYAPEFVSNAYEFVMNKGAQYIVFAVESCSDVFGYLGGKLSNIKIRYLTDGRQNVDKVLDAFNNQYPDQTLDFKSSLRLALTRFSKGEDVVIFFTMETNNQLADIIEILERTMEKYFVQPVLLGPSLDTAVDSLGKTTILIAEQELNDGDVSRYTKHYKSLGAYTIELGIGLVVRRPCKEEVQTCVYGACTKGKCPDSYSKYLTGFGKCEEKGNCFILPMRFSTDKFPFKEDSGFCSGESCELNEETPGRNEERLDAHIKTAKESSAKNASPLN